MDGDRTVMMNGRVTSYHRLGARVSRLIVGAMPYGLWMRIDCRQRLRVWGAVGLRITTIGLRPDPVPRVAAHRTGV